MVEDPPIQRLVGVVRRQPAALGRMVNDLLDVSRVTMGKIELAAERVALTEIVGRAAEGFREPAAAAGVQLELTLPDETLWVTVDTTRIEPVIANLVTNAIKSTPSGGTITIDDAREEGEAAAVVRGARAGRRIVRGAGGDAPSDGAGRRRST